MKKEKKLEFESYDDAAGWFEKSDMADYSERLVPVELTFDRSKRDNRGLHDQWNNLIIPKPQLFPQNHRLERE